MLDWVLKIQNGRYKAKNATIESKIYFLFILIVDVKAPCVCSHENEHIKSLFLNMASIY